MDSTILWYVARAGGLIAWALLALSVLWGLALSTKVMRGRPRPAWLLDLHRFLGALALVFTVVHVTTISLDTYVHFGPIEVLVPFTGTWHPVAVAWGILGFYALLAVEATSLLRRRLSRRAWRSTHYLAFPLFALTTIHALSAGTDRHTLAVRVAMFGAVGLVLALTGMRLAQSGRQVKPPSPVAPAPVAPAPVAQAVGAGRG